MACMTLIAEPLAMATTQFKRATCFENAAVWQIESSAGRKSLRMNWVVVTDSNGNRRLQMKWMPGIAD
jgi:hypothetical protein